MSNMQIAPSVQSMDSKASGIRQAAVGPTASVLASQNAVVLQNVSSCCGGSRYQVSTEGGQPVMAIVFDNGGCDIGGCAEMLGLEACGLGCSKPGKPSCFSCGCTEVSTVEFTQGEGKSDEVALALRFTTGLCDDTYVEFIENTEPLLRGEAVTGLCATLFGGEVFKLLDPSTKELVYSARYKSCCSANEIVFVDATGANLAEIVFTPASCCGEASTRVSFEAGLPAEHRSSIVGVAPIIFEWK